MKRVYLVQVNVTYNDYIAYLPYAAGCIAAYAWNDEEIRKNYELSDLLYMRLTIEESLGKITNPSVVAFSCYVWNMEYNLKLARLVKERYPDCLIVFGGHNVPDDISLLEKYSFIDVLMHAEGEEPFTLLLKEILKDREFSSVPDISFRKGADIIVTEKKRVYDISGYPSPYTAGLFDRIFEEYPNVNFHATLETNRGCPYSCAFCDWCFTKKIRYFPMEKIYAEIEWMAEHKITYCYCADANFGISKRDLDIANYILKKKTETGYPQVFKPCYAKESDDTVFEIGKILNHSGIDKGVTLAYQSLNEKTLENIGRKNLTLEHYADLTARYAEEKIPTYTELILGMPGETYESFCRGLCDLLENGQHNSMTVYTCQVYCNSPLAQKEYKEKHGIRWERQPLHGIHYPANFNGVQEYYDVVVETKDMSKEMWVKANMFSVCLQSFHHLGLLRCFAIYARYELGISYYEFYNRLLDYIFGNKERYIYKLFEEIRWKTEHTEVSDWCYQKDIFSKVGWYFEEGIFLDLIYNRDVFWKEIEDFINSLEIEKEVSDELFAYQKAIMRLPKVTELTVSSKYDFYSYFENIYNDNYSPLEKVETSLVINLEKQIDTWADYAREIIWFGKRRSATLCTNSRERIEIIKQ
ncbi:MAG: hypothetical protein E7558_03690 [Ruminococcaceae bacterium]|nr:hypothetical protein [Oscillospiraceae bacterium]